MSNQGYNALDYIFTECNHEVTEFQKKLTLNEKSISILLSKIDSLENGVYNNTKEKGDALESLTRYMFESLLFFNTHQSLHTSSNEIDFMVTLSDPGNVAKAKGYMNIENEFLIECKNYKSKVNVEYVGKFASLLLAQSKELGIMVSIHGITGTGWNAAIGLCKKLYLKTGTLLISFTLEDFRSLQYHSFFEIIEAKKQEIINDTNIDNFLKKHPSMQ